MGARPVLISLLTFTLLVAATNVSAQVGSGEITGTVRDQAGAAVPGASVAVRAIATGGARTVTSTANGVYAVAGLAPGEYRVDVELPGFRPLQREGIRVATGQTVRLDFDLTIGSIDERIVVRGDTPAVRREVAALGDVVDHATIVGLPLNGRSFVALTALAPGVALPPSSQLPRINGGRPRTNEYLFDGISMLQRQGNFTEAIGGRVPQIYDPATTAPSSGGSTRSLFPNNAIPPGRTDPVARALLQRYPLPTSSDTANNYTRTADELDNQSQFDVRLDYRISAGRDQAFVRASRFRGSFVPVA